jgi:hypothetical protein
MLFLAALAAFVPVWQLEDMTLEEEAPLDPCTSRLLSRQHICSRPIDLHWVGAFCKRAGLIRGGHQMPLAYPRLPSLAICLREATPLFEKSCLAIKNTP